MQAQMQGDPRPMMVAQAEMQDEFFEATGLDDEDFQAGITYWVDNDSEVKGMVMKATQ